MDTDVMIEILDRKSRLGAAAAKKLLESGEKVGTTSLAMHEILFGLVKYGKPTDAVEPFPVFPFEGADAKISSKLEVELEKEGTPIQRMDTMIAAIAINRGARLYTFNSDHFTRMSKFGLRLLD
ncbi:MAG: type II toxin-antitoxin system VapC family toxin [Thaumarchaeota archaeon]|nr:type II toxin-antitoxin system VapC family toxin [Nitrososphaerota archaeon]